jgi:hypothetical protein
MATRQQTLDPTVVQTQCVHALLTVGPELRGADKVDTDVHVLLPGVSHNGRLSHSESGPPAALVGCAHSVGGAAEGFRMIHLHEKETGVFVGTITDAQLQFLIDQLEEESADDTDYYIDHATLDLFEEVGAEADLLALLRQALGTRDGIEIVWSTA